MAGAIAVLLIAFVVACAAEAPKPCCTPKQWTGSFGESVGSSTRERRGHDRRGFMSLVSNITLDYTGQRMAMQSMSFRPGKRVARYNFIADYKKKMGYMIDVGRSKCFRIPLKKPMPSNCIPSSAKYYGSITLGSRAAGLKVSSWGVFFKTREMAGSAVISVDKSCIPVGEQVFGGNRRTGFMANIGYMDITGGIRDPKVFVPPSICKKGLASLLYPIRDSSLERPDFKSYFLEKYLL